MSRGTCRQSTFWTTSEIRYRKLSEVGSIRSEWEKAAVGVVLKG